jgi:hypothetical protein
MDIQYTYIELKPSFIDKYIVTPTYGYFNNIFAMDLPFTADRN